MSESWDKGQKPLELPNPDLNPLQNPTLGRNLGRWAQVYFTSPPEKREQAVVDLLRELRTEADPAAPRLEENSQETNLMTPGLICGVCQQPNQIDQRFCGLCGSPLASHSRPEQQAPRIAEIQSEVPATAAVPASTTEGEELQWLREKSLSRLSDSEEPSGIWKYALVVLVLIAAGFGILQWMSRRPAAEQVQPVVVSAPQPENTQPAPAPAAIPAPAPTVAQSAPVATKQPRVESSVVTENEIHAARVTTNAATRQTTTTEPPPAQTAASIEGGTQELYLAQGYLGGKHGVRDSAEAAKWLWKAVAKQNTTADVLLADLYLSGDGVARSCDQARLLLSAAAQKGQPSATEKLRQLESGGCR